MGDKIVLTKYLISTDEKTGTKYLIHTTFPKFIVAIDRGINIASTQLNVVEWWDEYHSTTKILDDAKLWLMNTFLEEKMSQPSNKKK